MSQLYPWKANGQLRRRPKAVELKKGRSRATNKGVLFLPGVHPHSSKARRYRDLARSYAESLSLDDERVRALVKDAASAAIMIEEMEAAMMRGDGIDKLEFTRLSGVRRRCLAKLDERRRQAAPPGAPPVEGAAGLARLRARLAEIAAKG
jgi:hypothetical protein